MQTDSSDYTITTIYFDGQFWTALIEKSVANIHYSGRHIFGAEPTNPELRNWMLFDFLNTKMFRCNQPVKIKIHKEVVQQRSLSKALDAYKEAQKEFLEQKHKEKTKQKHASAQEKYRNKQLAKKRKR